MKFTDAATVAGTRRTGDGYLVADARIARTGIQAYLGSEVGKPDMSMVKVYRPGAEVFAEDTLKSAAHRPVTNNHPLEMVTSDNWKKYAVGQTGDEIGESASISVSPRWSATRRPSRTLRQASKSSPPATPAISISRQARRQTAKPTTPFRRISGSTTSPSWRRVAPARKSYRRRCDWLGNIPHRQ
jgi:hypothetical protein